MTPEDYSYKNPDQKAINWLSNWLEQRKGIVSKYAKKNGYDIYKVIPEQISSMKNTSIQSFDYSKHSSNLDGYYNPVTLSISYNDEKPFTYMNTRVHERTHSLFGNVLDSNKKPQIKHIGSFNPSKHLDRSFVYWLNERTNDLDKFKWNYWSNYYDDPDEIYSRLMEFRYENNLDPKKVWTKDDIKALRQNRKIKDFDLLERYDDEFILRLFNEVAQNSATQDNQSTYAKRGIKLVPRRK